MAVGIYDNVIAFDHKKNKCRIITHADDEATAKKKQSYLLDLIEDVNAPTPETSTQLEWSTNFSRRNYEAVIQKTIDYIKAGDIFQANIAQRFDAELPNIASLTKSLVSAQEQGRNKLLELNAKGFAQHADVIAALDDEAEGDEVDEDAAQVDHDRAHLVLTRSATDVAAVTQPMAKSLTCSWNQ